MYIDTYMALLDMACGIRRTVICTWLVIQIQIGQVACRIKRVLPDVVSVWDLLLFPGSVGNTRSNICFVVSTLSQYMCEPRQTHWVAVKHVLRYLHGTVGYGLRYSTDNDMHLVGYTDSEWEGSMQDRKSTSKCCFSLGSIVISWFNKSRL